APFSQNDRLRAGAERGDDGGPFLEGREKRVLRRAGGRRTGGVGPGAHQSRSFRVWRRSGACPSSRCSAVAGSQSATREGHSTTIHHGDTRKSSIIRSSSWAPLSSR